MELHLINPQAADPGHQAKDLIYRLRKAAGVFSLPPASFGLAPCCSKDAAKRGYGKLFPVAKAVALGLDLMTSGGPFSPRLAMILR